jgi:hypothetical protein
MEAKTPMMRRIYRFFILSTGILLVSGCLATLGKLNQLENTLRAYEGAIRWSEFELAKGFGVPVDPTPDLTRLNHIAVTAYEVKASTTSGDTLEARQTVVIHYYDKHSAMQKTVIHQQQWHYDENQKQWVVQPSLPDF